ncbi:MAG: hypothetical protein J1F35_01800 [Erysipelotrichales bacterium]|nr:hypothetical protein [Erysipelotrichales bacterium]
MKKIFRFLVVITFFTCFSLNVYAEEDTTCNYSSKATLQKSAYNVDANYTIKKDENGSFYFEISVYNITDDIYAVVTNDINGEEVQIYNNITTNNNYSFNIYDTTTIVNYVVHVRAIKYGCNDELRKIRITKPRYNDLSEIAICKNDIMLDYSYCKTWVNKYFSETREEVIEKINNQYNKFVTEPTTECILCKASVENSKKIRKQLAMKIAIVIGLIVAIILDILIIILLTNRLKRYDI